LERTQFSSKGKVVCSARGSRGCEKVLRKPAAKKDSGLKRERRRKLKKGGREGGSRARSCRKRTLKRGQGEVFGWRGGLHERTKPAVNDAADAT